MELLRSKHFPFLVFSPPSHSFRSGPSSVRSSSDITLSNDNGTSYAKYMIENENHIIDIIIRAIKLCVDSNIHYVIYGSAKSLFWTYPGLLEAAMTPSASSVTNI